MRGRKREREIQTEGERLKYGEKLEIEKEEDLRAETEREIIETERAKGREEIERE